MSKVFRPAANVSNRKVSQTAEDRARQLVEFREDKDHKQKLKEERYAKMAEKRKQRAGGKGIDVRVSGDK